MSEKLLISDEGEVRTLTLNRPEVLNALDGELRAAVVDALADAGADPSIRVVILTGSGDRAFSAGQDLNEAKAVDDSDSRAWQESWEAFYGAFLDTNMPIIVALNGLAAGGGFVISSLGDIRVMSDQARLIMAEINIGLPSIFGSYYLMSQVFLSRTVDIVLTGRDIPAEEAKRIGWAHEVVPPGEVMERAQALAAELCEKAPTPLRLTVTRFRTVAKREFAEVAESLTRYQMEAVATGEPARVMAGFFAERERRKAAG